MDVKQAVGECLAGLDHSQVTPHARRKIEAAIERAALTVKPRVKLLAWGETSYGSPESFTVTGVYRINGAFDGGWSVSAPGRRMLVSSDGRQNLPTINDAKAAAQADYEARIMSALTTEDL